MPNFFDQFDSAQPSAPTRITVRPSDATSGGNFFDQFDTSPVQQVATGFMNQGSAAGQLTTPDIGAQSKNLISADTYEGDSGDVMYRDPASGQVVPTDKNKQVALRDPADNKVKVYARTSDTDEGRLSAAGRLLMTGMGSSAPTARPSIPLPSKSRAPTVPALKRAATAGYESPEAAGVLIEPDALKNFSQSLQAELNAHGADENVAPMVFGILRKLETPAPEGTVGVTVKNLQSLKETLSGAADSLIRRERQAGTIARKAVDDFLANLPESSLIAGDAEAASAKLGEANANYSAAMRATTIDKKQVRAELRAAAANSGRNLSNTMKQRLADILLNPKEHAGWSESELKMAEQVVRGSKLENLTRYVGNFLGGGGGLGALLTADVGARTFGPAGSLLAVPGAALKSLSNVMTMRQIGKLSEAIRSRAPLAKSIGGPLTDWAKATQNYETARSPRTVSMLALAARNLVNNLKDAGVHISPAELMKSIQGPVRAPAEQEQP